MFKLILIAILFAPGLSSAMECKRYFNGEPDTGEESIGTMAVTEGMPVLMAPSLNRRNANVTLNNNIADPVINWVNRMHAEGNPVTRDALFNANVAEINRNSCRCKPLFLKRWMVAAIDGVNVIFRHIFTRTTSQRSLHKKLMGRLLASTRGDVNQLSQIIGRVRNKFMRAFIASVEADMAYVKAGEELANLTASAAAHEGSEESQAYKLISSHSEAIKSRYELKSRKQEIEQAGTPIADSPNSSEYAVIMIELRDLDKEIGRIERRGRSLYRRLHHRLRRRGDDAQKLDYELVDVWLGRIRAEKQAQLAHADLIVAEGKIQVVEEFLKGSLNGFEGPIDVQVINEIAEVLAQNYSYLGHEVEGRAYFSSFYGASGRVELFDSNLTTDAVAKYNLVKDLVSAWRDIWYLREIEIASRLEFNFAFLNIGIELGRNLTARNIDTAMRGGLESARDIVQKIRQRIRQRSNPESVVDSGYENIAAVESAFAKLEEFVRAQTILTETEIRDLNSDIQLYFDYLREKNLPLDQSVALMFSTASAMDVARWMYIQHNTRETGGMPYSQELMERIIEIQSARLLVHLNLGADLLEQMIKTGTAATAAWGTLTYAWSKIAEFF